MYKNYAILTQKFDIKIWQQFRWLIQFKNSVKYTNLCDEQINSIRIIVYIEYFVYYYLQLSIIN